MIRTERVDWEDLTLEEQGWQPNNGCGKEWASYLKVWHNEKVLYVFSCAMEPEDVRFYRDLSWVGPALEKCYELGRGDAKAAADLRMALTFFDGEYCDGA